MTRSDVQTDETVALRQLRVGDEIELFGMRHVVMLANSAGTFVRLFGGEQIYRVPFADHYPVRRYTVHAPPSLDVAVATAQLLIAFPGSELIE